MSLTRLIGRLDWRYAFAEVVLIVFGILIALAASDWQTARDERHTELEMLAELETSLTADITSLHEMLARYRRIADRASRLRGYMMSGGEYADSLNAYFGTVWGFQPLDFNLAGYESLKSQGLGLVSNSALRSEIARVYEQAYPLAAEAVEMERTVNVDLLRPYFLRHFRNFRFNESAEPMDYNALLADGEFLNLLDYRIQVTRQNHIEQFERVIPQLEELVQEIRVELER